MRNPVTAVLMGVLLIVAVGNVSAQIAGSTTPGMSVEELQTIARGWSVTKQMLGKPVYNAKNERSGMSMTSSSRPIVRARMPSLAWGDFWAWANARWQSPPTISSIPREGSCCRMRRKRPCRPCRHSNTRNKDASAASAVRSSWE